MKKIIVLGITLCFLTACSMAPQSKTTEAVISHSEQTNSLWDEDTIDESLITDTSLLNQKEYSIEFWVKPEENRVGTVLFSMGDNEHFIQCTTLGSNKEVEPIQYSGLSLVANKQGQETWLVADGNHTLKTGQYNQVIVTFASQQATIYLNGEQVAQGDFPYRSIENYFQFGKGFDGSPGVVGKVAGLTIRNQVKSLEEISTDYEKNRGRVSLDLIQFTNTEDVTEGVYLLNSKVNGVPVSWQSSHPDVLDTNLKFEPQQQDTLVTMTATVDFEGIDKVTKEFDFMVKHVDQDVILDRDSKSCNSWVEKVTHSGTLLPTMLSYGSMVTWEVVSGDASITNNEIVKTSNDKKADVTLKASVSYGDGNRELTYDITLIDEVGGYLLSYFDGIEGEETGRLAYSYDGLNWEQLNQGESIITTELGTKRVRDPFIARDRQGEFVILATEGFDNPSIYVMRSSDLLDFSHQQLIQISYLDEGLQMDGTRAWAPEMIYDMKNDQYVITFSNPSNEFVGEIYAVTSKDLETMSYPYTLFAPGYEVIDASIIAMNGKYRLFYKDEREGAKTVFYATSSVIDGFKTTNDSDFIFHKKYIEGPFVVETPTESYLYVDNYPTATFYVAKFTESEEGLEFEWLPQDQYQLPNDAVRHGSVIPVTTSELDKLINYYN